MSSGPVRLNIYDLAGRLLRGAWDQSLPAGSRVVTWDGLDARHVPLPTGTYYYELQGGGRRVTRSLTVLR